jgi:hypothetical protein
MLSHILRLHPHRLRGIISDEAPIAPNAVSCSDFLVHKLFGARSGEVSIFESALLARMTRVRMAKPTRASERSSIGWYSHDYLARADSLLHHIGDSRVTRRGRLSTVRDLWGEQLSMVAGFLDPGSSEVIRHKVDHVQVTGSMGQVDMLERPFACGQGRR